MNSILKYLLTGIISLVLYSGCDNAKVISSDDDSSLEDKTGIFSGMTPPSGAAKANQDDLHTVVVEEVLPTSKYIYLYVRENGKSFWIATVKQIVEVGETYVYKGGLLKTNFESKEHNRIFDKMYLVSRLLPLKHGSSDGATETTAAATRATDKEVPPTVSKKIEREGSMKIADLVANPEKYEGKIVQLSGKCVKVNPNIMGRNWIHLKDGSQDDYDLVLTSDVAIPEGHIVTMKGLVVLNKDFGAGYRYALLLEDGVIVQ